VRCGIGVVIGLDFDDPATRSVEEQYCSDQIRSDIVHAAAEEGSG
jgi:hypothetical protein